MSRFKVKLLETDGDNEATLWLPFAPFAGLNVQVPWRGGDFAEIVEVYWYSNKERFDAFIRTDPEEDEKA